MAIKINERLNLVVPLYDEADKVYAYVHSMPISREAFEISFRLIAATYSEIGRLGLAGARVSHLLLNDVAKNMAGADENAETVSRALLNEIHRLSNVIMPTDAGWETMPLQQALDRKLLDAEDVPEVLSAVVFFTVAWHMHPKAQRKDFMEGGARMWGAQTTSLASTAYTASLPTSTAPVSSGAKSEPTNGTARHPTAAVVEVVGRQGVSSLPS